MSTSITRPADIAALNPKSANFGFLAPYDAALVRLAALAEFYALQDPNTALLKVRQFSEALLQRVAARVGVPAGPQGSQLAVETLAEGILHRFPRANELEDDALSPVPMITGCQGISPRGLRP